MILLSRLIIKFLQFVRILILARLLFPQDFGLFGLAALAMSFAEAFFHLGFPQAFIHKEGDQDKYLNTIWTFNVVRGVFLGLLLYFVVAPLSGSFFDNVQVVVLAKFLALATFITSLENISILLIKKKMQFNKFFSYSVINTVAEIILVIALAFFLRNVWAFAIGVVGRNLIATIMSYVIHSYRPKFSFDWQAARELFKFGKWLGFASIVTFLAKQGDYLIIGKLLDAYSLGLYQVAFALGTLMTTEVSRVLENLLFPLFSRIRGQAEYLKRAFTKLFRMTFSIIIPASFGLYILAEEIVGLFYGQRWLEMVPIINVVILISLLLSFKSIVTPLFLGKGNPKIATLTQIVHIIILFALAKPLADLWGVVGIAWAFFIGLLASQLILFIKLRREVNLGVRGFLAIISLPVLASLFMSFILYIIKQLWLPQSPAVLLLYILAGIIVYGLAIYLLDKVFGKKYYQSLLWIKKNI